MSGARATYRLTGVRVRAKRVALTPKIVQTHGGYEVAKRGDYVVTDEYGQSVWSADEFTEAFEVDE